MKQEEKFLVTGRAWSDMCHQLKADCLEYLTRVLRENGNRIEFDTEDDNEYMCISYDGGNHPEYASNICSTVYAVQLNERGNVSVECEDSDDYEYTRLEIVDLYTIADNVYAKLNKD